MDCAMHGAGRIPCVTAPLWSVLLEPTVLVYNLAWKLAGRGALRLLSPGAAQDPEFMAGRLGHYSIDDSRPGGPRIWIHASSVGEVTGAAPIVRATLQRLPGARVFLTVGTPQGYRFANARLGGTVTVLPFPIDLPDAVDRAMDAIRPDIYVALEGEFWPNVFRALKMRGVPAVLLNGRVSNRSARRYRVLGSLFGPIFRQFQTLAMLTPADLDNVLSLGAAPERSFVLGSSKYDGIDKRADPLRARKLRELLAIPDGAPVVVGGSLRGREHGIFPRVLRSLLQVEPRTVGILVPRHLEKIPEASERLREAGIEFQLFTRIESGQEARHASAVLVDRMGVLFDLYGIGDLLFCGGTLEPVGGHNIVEPAAWGKPVFHGPHLKKVTPEHTILQSHGASFTVSDERELTERWVGLIGRLDELKPHGQGALEAVRQLGGAASMHAEIIVSTLNGNTGGTCRE